MLREMINVAIIYTEKDMKLQKFTLASSKTQLIPLFERMKTFILKKNERERTGIQQKCSI